MEIIKVKKRSVVFKFKLKDWDLNLHLILGDKYNYIIDTGLGSDSIKPVLEYLDGDTKPIVVIITHYHWDHIWGNGCFKDNLIVAHETCFHMIEEHWNEMLLRCGEYKYGEVIKVMPNLLFQNELYFAEDNIRIYYTPGHSIDCISILDEREHVLNVGDNIGDTMEALIPEIDTSKELYIETLMKYKEIEFDTCISGHNIIVEKDVIDTILKNLE